MAINLFGFTISKKDPDEDKKTRTFATPVSDDGAATVQAGGYYGTYLDLDATAKSESELITRYREASMYSDCAAAIDEIITEAIANVEDEPVVKINMDKLNIPEDIKETVEKEFKKLLEILEFNSKSYDIFRRWYVDGRIYYQKIIDKSNPKKGILELIQLDPRKIRKVREIKREKDPNTGIDFVKSMNEFFIYNEQGINYSPNYASTKGPNQGLKINTDSITFIPSGLVDLEKNVVLSYLHKAIKPVNQLKMMEDALVIYRLSRAPERRIFYIDVGNLPKVKAEQYLKDIMARYRNKIVYDSATGEVRDDRKFMSMLEDFWLPRREGGRGTEITTLPGGENLGQIDDINYFQNKLYQSLNVPISRMQPQTGISFGRATEITRDELKFGKFVGRLRKKFCDLFNDLLRTQLILKGILTDKDWETMKEDIKYKFAQDQYFEEIKNAENFRNRIDLLTQMQPYVGYYFSKSYIQKNILRLENTEIEQIDQEIEQEPPPPGPQGMDQPPPQA